MSSRIFEEQLAFGLRIERQLVELLGTTITGLQLTPISAGPHDKHGPRVWGADFRNIDLPAHDMRGDFTGHSFDVQVKGKGYAPWFRQWSTHTHGIDLPIYQSYEKGRHLVGRKLWIIFFEMYQSPDDDAAGYVPSALAQFWHRLPPAQFSDPSASFPDGGAFWPRGAFVPIANTNMRPPTLVMGNDGSPVAQLELRREFLLQSMRPPGVLPSYWDDHRLPGIRSFWDWQAIPQCGRCGNQHMFKPKHRDMQTPIWLCMRCDAPIRYPQIEEKHPA